MLLALQRRLTLPKSFADGKRRQSQLFMRARVVAQGVTVAAMMSCLAWQGMQNDEKAAAAAASAASASKNAE
jgi:hypothetical protein